MAPHPYSITYQVRSSGPLISLGMPFFPSRYHKISLTSLFSNCFYFSLPSVYHSSHPNFSLPTTSRVIFLNANFIMPLPWWTSSTASHTQQGGRILTLKQETKIQFGCRIPVQSHCLHTPVLFPAPTHWANCSGCLKTPCFCSHSFSMVSIWLGLLHGSTIPKTLSWPHLLPYLG